MLKGDSHRALTGEWWATGERLVENHSQRIDIASSVGGCALGLFGAEIGCGTDDGAGLGQLLAVIPCPGNPEVGDLHRSVLGQQDVARFHVAMNQPGLMGN